MNGIERLCVFDMPPMPFAAGLDTFCSHAIHTDLLHEPVLQLVLIREAERFHLSLHRRRGLPLILDRLVAAEMNVFSREQLQDLVEHVLDEGIVHVFVNGTLA